MTGNGRLALVVTGLLSSSAMAQEPSLLLRYLFDAEPAQRVSVSSASEINLGGVALSEGRGQVMLMSPAHRLGAGVTLVYQISRQTLRLNGEGVDVNFDTANIEAPTTRERLSQLSESVGHTFHRTVDDRGQILSRDDDEVPVSMVEMSLLAMPLFPEDRVAVGEVWESVSEVSISATDKMVVSRRYSLESVTDGIAIATYDVATAALESGGERPVAGTLLDSTDDGSPVSLVGTGRFLFDLQRGVLVSLSESTHLEGAMNGLPLSVSTEWDVVIE